MDDFTEACVMSSILRIEMAKCFRILLQSRKKLLNFPFAISRCEKKSDGISTISV